MYKSLKFGSILLVVVIPALGHAQHAPYAGMQERDIKSLSHEQVEQYLDGAGMGFALAAELNGYPGPRHVLDLASELELQPEQRRVAEAARERMSAEARELGEEIVKLERELDEVFAKGDADAASVERLSTEIGRLNGKLRAAHLRAHLDVKGVLTPHQIHRYAMLRGYGDGTKHHHHGH